MYLNRDKMKLKIFKILATQKNIWIGTDNGLYSIDKFNHNVEHYDMFGEKTDIDDPVAADFIAIASNDSISVFSRFEGLLLYEHDTEQFKVVPQVFNMANLYIYDMALDDDYLWVATNDGAYLIRLADYYTEHYTESDGLAGNLVYKVQIAGEDVWFGTNCGLTRYKWRRYAD
jgi:ligand-binding sensor domain-containing protein